MTKALLRSLLLILTLTLTLLANALLGQTIHRVYQGSTETDPNTVISGCGGVALQFIISPQLNHTYSNYNWEIYDGVTYTPFSNLAEPYHQFNSTGIYGVRVTYDDTFGGATSSVTATIPNNAIEVYSRPDGQFYADKRNICVGEEITLVNITPGTFSSLNFLVDNQLYPVVNDSAKVTINNSGSFDVALSGTTTDGCQFIANEAGYITVQAPFTSTFTTSQTISCASTQTITFTASSIDTDGLTVTPTYFWDWGDGTFDTTNVAAIQHTFDSSDGTDFTVSLSSEANNCPGTSTQTENIYFRDISSLYGTASISGTCNTHVVSYTPGTIDPLFSGLQVLWDWGDGNTETIVIGDVATHTYSNPNPNPINVNISATIQGLTDNSCQFTDVQTVPILPQAGISIAANNTDYCSENFNVIVNAINLQNVANYYWVIDGTTITGFNQSTDTLAVAGYGSHTIELYFDAQTGDINDNCALNSIDVYSAPLDVRVSGANFACEPSSDSFASSVTWEDRNTNTVTNPFSVDTEEWMVINKTYDDTTYYTVNPLTFTNLSHGDYDIYHNITLDPIGDNSACTFSSPAFNYLVGEVFDNPTLNFSPSTICIGTTVNFSTTTHADTLGLGLSGEFPIVYQYRYASNLNWVTVGNTGLGQFYYGDIVDSARTALPGTFTVEIRAVINGCAGDPTVETITINPSEAEHEITLDDCAPTTLSFINNSLGTTDTDYQWTLTIDPPGNGNSDEVTWTSQSTKDENYNFLSEATFPTFTGYPQGEIPESSVVDIRITATEPGVGCSDFEDTTIVMPGPLPVLSPSPSTSSGTCVNSILQFDAGDGNLGQVYNWTFTNTADNSIQFSFSSNNSIVNTTFPTPGSYSGVVTVTTAGGCTFSENLGPIQITGGSVNVTGLAAACVGDNLTFQGQNLMYSPTQPDYEWFVDGVSQTSGTVPISGNVPDLTGIVFSTPNSPQNLAHTITLELSINGCSASYTHDITVTKPDFTFPLPHDNFVAFDYVCDEVITELTLDLDDNEVYNLSTSTINLFTGGVGVGAVTPNSINNDTVRVSLPAGPYNLTIQVVDENGCSDDQVLSFTVPTMRDLAADFTPNTYNLVCPGFVSFTDLADETAGNTSRRDDLDLSDNLYDVDIALWEWDFDNDGTIDATTNSGSVTHYYSSPGSYDAVLTVTDNHGCQDVSNTVTIVVGGTSGTYEILKKIGFEPASTTMVAFPVDDPNTDITNTIYNWASGDGQLGTDSSQVFVYPSTISNANMSTITPSLTFVDENGCSYPADYSGDMTILNCPDISSPDVTLCTDAGAYTLNVEDLSWNGSFNASDTIETSEYMYYWELQYRWFVDGNPITQANGGHDSEVIFNHGPIDTAPFTIDPDDSDGKLYTIQATIIANYIDKNDASNNQLNVSECVMTDDIRVIYNATPVAAFVNDEVCNGSATTLDARNTDFGIYNDEQIAQFEWDIDNDGTYDITTTDSVTTYTFPNQGVYPVALRVTSNDGCFSTTSKDSVIVNANPTANFTYQNNCLSYGVSFDDLSTITPVTDDEIVRWDWDFNSNGTIDFGGTDTLLHRFPTIDFTTQLDGNGSLIGFDQVLTTTLTVTTNKGCTHTFTPTADSTLVYIFQEPDAGLSAQRLNNPVANEVCLGQTMQFTDQSTIDNSNLNPFITAGDLPANVNDITTWLWEFGDGNISTVADPQHDYASTGTYTVKLRVTSARGCTDIDSITVYVRENPDPEIGQDSIIVNDTTTVQLRPLANDSTNFAYLWTKLSGPTNGNITESALNIHNATVDVDEPDFNTGESIIDVRYQLQVTDNNHPTACSTLDTVDVQIHRMPVINLDTTLVDCGVTASYLAKPFGSETIAGFTYTWSNAFTNGGTINITNTSLQDFTVTPNTFDNGSSRIHTKFYIDVVNTIGGADRDSIEFYFYRSPDFSSLSYNYQECNTPARNLYEVNFSPFGSEVLPHNEDYDYTWSMSNNAIDHNIDPAFLTALVNQVNASDTSQNLSLDIFEDYFVDDSVNLWFDINLHVENTHSNTCLNDTTFRVEIERRPRDFTLVDTRLDSCDLSVTLNHHTETLNFNYRWQLRNPSPGFGGTLPADTNAQIRTITFTDADFATGAHVFEVTANNRVRKMAPGGADAIPHCGINRNLLLRFYRTPDIVFTETKAGGNPCAKDAEISSGSEIIPGFDYSWTQTSITGGVLNEDALTNKDINVSVSSWDLNSTVITATYELRVENSASPTCFDVESYTINFFRTPEITYNPTPLACALNDTITANSEALNGATFYWNVNSLTGGSIDTVNNGNQYLIEVDTFATGSHRLDAQYQLIIDNTTLSSCDDDTTFNIAFFRTPEITFSQTRTDSCASTNTLKPFGNETISGYNYQWRELYVNGGTINASSLTGQDLTVDVTSFNQDTAYVVVAYELTVQNTDATGCSDIDTVEFQFYRTPSLSNYSQLMPLNSCGLMGEVYPLGTTEVINHGDGFDYSWTFDSVTGAGADGATLSNATLDSILSKANEQNFILNMPITEFASGSNEIQLSLDLHIEHSDADVTCQTDTTIVISYKRPPVIAMQTIKSDSCAYTTTLQPFGLETINGFDYQWSIASISGYDGNDGDVSNDLSVGNLSTNQDLTITITDDDFIDNESKIVIALELDVANNLDPSNTSCQDMAVDTLVFYRTPIIDAGFSFIKAANCDHIGTSEPFATNINGFSYVWMPVTVTGGNVNHTSLSDRQITIDVDSFSTNSLQIDGLYRLRVFNTEVPSCYDEEDINFEFYRTPEITFSQQVVNCASIDSSITFSTMNEAFINAGESFSWHLDNITGGTIDSTNNNSSFIVDVKTFDTDAAQIGLQYSVSISNSSSHTCDDDTTFNVTFYRAPEIEFLSARTDSCSHTEIMEAFNGEAIPLFDRTWRQISVSGGTVIQNSANNDDILNVSVDAFDLNAATITVQYELTATNSLSPTCSDIDTVEFNLYRSPNFTAYTQTDPLGLCGGTFHSFPLGNTEIINHGDGFDYTWTLDASSVSGAIGGTLISSVLDSIIAQENIQNFELTIPDSAYALGSNMISFNMDLNVQHSNSNLICSSTDTTILFQFYRYPDISIVEDKLDSCALTSTLQPFGSESIAGFNYAWNITSINGYDGSDYSVGDTYNTQNTTFTVTDDDFVDNESHIEITLQLTAVNTLATADPTCSNTVNYSLNFYRTPDIDTPFLSSKLNNCDYNGTASPFPNDVNGYVYIWTLDSIRNGALNDNASSMQRELTVSVDSFNTLESIIHAYYKLRVVNTLSNQCFDEDTISFKFYRTPEMMLTNMTGACQSSILVESHNAMLNDVDFDWTQLSLTGGTITSTPAVLDGNRSVTFNVNSFNSGQSQIDASYNITMLNSGESMCDDDTTFMFSLFREPEINITYSRASSDSCDAALTLYPFANENITGFANTWSQVSINGGNVNHSSLTDENLTVTVDTFALHSTRIDTRYLIETFNVNSPACEDSMSLATTLYRQANFTAFVEERTEDCGLTVDFYPLGKQENIQHNNGFDYTWTLNTSGISGAGSDGNTLPQAVLDSITAQINSQNLSITLPMDAFAPGSNTIEIPFNIEISNTYQNSCVSDLDTTMIFYRPATINIAQSLAGCGIENIITSYGNENVASSFDFTWTIYPVGGTISNSSLNGQDLTLNNPVFNSGSDTILVDVTLQVENNALSFTPGVTSCEADTAFRFYFYRQPVLNLAQTITSCDTLNLLTTFGSEVIAGYNYNWDSVNVLGGQLNIGSGYSKTTQNIELLKSLYDSGSHRIDVSYTVSASNSDTLGNTLCTDTENVSFSIFRVPDINVVQSLTAGDCGNQNDISLFGNELISGYNVTWSEVSVNGGSINLSSNSNQNVTFDTPQFDPTSNQIDVTYTVSVTNSDSPTCTDSETVSFTFYRTPDPTISTISSVCSSNSITLQTVENYVPQFNYTWNLLNITPDHNPNAEGLSAPMVSQVNNTYVLNTPIDQEGFFPTGAAMMTYQYEVMVENSISTLCQERDTIDAVFYRNPIISATQSLDSTLCQQVNVIRPFNTEIIPNFDYTWNQVSVSGGTIDTTHINNGQDVSFSVVSFDSLSHRIDVSYSVDVSNTLSGCSDSEIFTFTFFRTPLTDLSMLNLSPVCRGTSVSLFPMEAENTGYNYTWNRISILSDDGTDLLSAGIYPLESGLNTHTITLDHNPSFPNSTVRVTAIYELQVMNMDNGCTTTDQVTVVFDREAMLSLTANKFNVCDDINLTLQTVEPRTDNYDYNWSIDTIFTDNNASITTLNNIDTSTAGALTIDADPSDFPDGASLITATFNVQTDNHLNTNCTADTAYTLEFARKPMISFTDNHAECALDTVTVKPFGNEVINGYDYTWSISSIDGFNGSNADIINGQTSNQNFSLHFEDDDFTVGRSQIEITLDLNVNNPNGSSCGDNAQHTLVFFRVPHINFTATKASNDSCANQITISPFSETISDYTYQWTKISETNGTVAEVNSTVRDLVVNTPNFNQGETQIDVLYELQVINTNPNASSPCITTEQVDISFFKTPVVPTHLLTSAIGCGKNGSLKALTFPITDSQVNNYVFDWTINSTSGGTIDTLSTYDSLHIDRLTFDNGSGTVSVDVDVMARNAYQPSSCFTTRNETLEFYRTPEITLNPDQADQCETGNIVITTGEELVGDFDYNWSYSISDDLSLNTGTVDTTSSGSGGHVLTFSNPTFPTGASYIEISATLNTSHRVGSCSDTETVTIRFHKQPTVSLISSPIVSCETGFITINPTQAEVNNFTYTWERTLITSDVSDNTGASIVETPSGSGYQMRLTDPEFPNGAAQVTARYKLTISNPSNPYCLTVRDSIDVTFFRSPDTSLGDDVQASCNASQITVSPTNEESIDNFNYTWRIDQVDTDIQTYDSRANVSLSSMSIYNPQLIVNTIPADASYVRAFITLETENSFNNCGTSTDQMGVTFLRTPTVTLPQTGLQGCDTHVYSLAPSEVQWSGMDYSWSLINISGGSIATQSNLDTYNATFANPTFNSGSYMVTADVVLTVNNKLDASCLSSDTTTIQFYRTPVANINVQNGFGCEGETVYFLTDNSIALEPGSIFEWDFDNNGSYEIQSYGDTTHIFGSIGTHTVNLRITSPSGCVSNIDSQNVEVYEVPTPSFTTSDICIGDIAAFNNTTPQLSSSGDNRITSIKWDFDYDENSVPNFTNSSTHPTYQYPTSGTFAVLVEVTNAGGCSATFMDSITVHALPVITMDDDIWICQDAAATITPQVDVPVTYNWSTGQTTQSIDIAPSEETTYTLTVTNEYGCVNSKAVTVHIVPDVVQDFVQESCETDPITFDGRIPAYPGVVQTFEWSTGETSATIDVLETGTYSLRTIVEHESGTICEFNHEYQATFHPNPGKVLEDTTFCFEFGDVLDVAAIEGDNFSYEWNTGETSRVITKDRSGVFTVLVIDETHATRCSTMDTIHVNQICPARMNAPNAFTPNGDGNNDEFLLEPAYAVDIDLHIYNNWGESIFHKEYTNSFEAGTRGNGWNGTYKGAQMMSGSYTYTIRYVSQKDGSVNEKTGQILLIR
ncbi:PKD domain-containing protein [Flammeovirga sp. SubArs3]|uniref:PKD domain-containing protein n=1 Tax=Flammeovirga sp. SubArs3 TaxID=2995316 RepID=UPI00248B6E07|nr:PKD domain-containing protein [Flammeovirga sp. SubArs3]